MKEIKVLGPGCAKCKELAEKTIRCADSMKLEYNFEKVEDINRIMEYGVMFTPALIVDGVVKISGKVPPEDELKKMLSS